MSQETAQKTLNEVVSEKPFDDYQEWWSVGNHFVSFMSRAICGEWQKLPGDSNIDTIDKYVGQYIETVYRRSPRKDLASAFLNNSLTDVHSGEFDALSYAFYRHAFERLASAESTLEHSVERERRLYTKRVGKVFFEQVANHIQLSIPDQLASAEELRQLDLAIQSTGKFLGDEGYLKTHFAFVFDVDVEHGGLAIRQTKEEVIANLESSQLAHAIYEMGYPIILPSAVYLYHTIGEAQHHSSRTIEELFERTGCEARETDDFDPIGYPSDRVVELWEIKPLS